MFLAQLNYGPRIRGGSRGVVAAHQTLSSTLGFTAEEAGHAVMAMECAATMFTLRLLTFNLFFDVSIAMVLVVDQLLCSPAIYIPLSRL